ncbi:MAG: HPr(Ser) kinase/phosphatase [Gemmatimonadales bacterium]
MITVADLIERKKESLELEELVPGVGLSNEITVPEVSSPGLALAGYTARFVSRRLYALGETEISYLFSLTKDERRNAIVHLLEFDLPCVFVTKGLEVPPELIEAARDHETPVLRSQLSTLEFYRRISPYLEEVFSPSTSVHGSLADVYGVGLLFMGRSGIGKSECVLDLVERGHRLVADDMVHVSRRGSSVLIGRADELTYRYMEIRGIGLVDVSSLFGVRAVRQQKRIEVVVELTDWDSAKDVERTGLETRTREILGVHVPEVAIPLNPGKNIGVVSEVVALSHLLRYSGTDSARAFNDRLIEQMAKQKDLREYLAEDYE